MAPRCTVLCIGGHDPTGGAGLQADIETLVAHRVRACTLVTCLTAQDTRDVRALWPTPIDAFRRQLDTLLADLQPNAVKLGLLGSADIAAAVADALAALALPVILDPVLAAGGGKRLGDDRLIEVLREQILPRTSLALPNSNELTTLADETGEAAAAERLLSLGVAAVLVTGADAAAAISSAQVINSLYTTAAPPRAWNWPRLPHVYHGSGCTLASACAAALARNTPLQQAVEQAQTFTWRALEHAEAAGSGQRLPTRFR